MNKLVYQTDEVYGISRDVPLNYAVRPKVDNVLIEALRQKRHVVIYGSSKQGKTSLRKRHLADKPAVILQCYHTWDLAQLNSSILKQAGYVVTQSQTKTQAGKHKVTASLDATFFGFGAKAGAEQEGTVATQTQTAGLDLDPEDVNEVIRALNASSCPKLIILEDFHYLPVSTQVDFSIALKAFHEASDYQFVVIGVWREENRLIVYNGDLAGRVVSVNADHWEDYQLRDVIFQGERALNIIFPEQFKVRLIEQCFESVYIVQEACRTVCQASYIFRTQNRPTMVGSDVDVTKLTKTIVSQQTARYEYFMTSFAAGFQDTDLQMYRWILYPVIQAGVDELGAGLPYSHLREIIQAHHPAGKVNPGNLTQALRSIASLQVSKNIKPIILDYDQTDKRLQVVDRGFIIWLANQDVDALMTELGFSL